MIKRLLAVGRELEKEIANFRDYYTKELENDLINFALYLLNLAEIEGYFNVDKKDLKENLEDVNAFLVEDVENFIDKMDIDDDEISTTVNIFAELFKDNVEMFSLIAEVDKLLETPNFYKKEEEIDFEELKETLLTEIKKLDFAKIFAQTQAEVAKEIAENKKMFADLNIKMSDLGIYRFK